MKNQDTELRLDPNFTMCFINDCPKADKCARRKAFEQFGNNREQGKAILPSSLKNGQCDFFLQADMQCAAKGASHLFDEVRMKHYKVIRDAVIGIFESRNNFYRSIKGTRYIKEDDQKKIIDLMEQYGYPTDNLFDEFLAIYEP